MIRRAASSGSTYLSERPGLTGIKETSGPVNDAPRLDQQEAMMISLPDDWFLYLAAGAMGLFMITMMFVTMTDRQKH